MWGRTPRRFALDRVSVEPSNRCGKACAFCYNGSNPAGADVWDVADLIDFARSCARHGVRALSLGGGEPLEYPGLFAALKALRGVLFRSFTTNGLLLDDRMDAVVGAAPDKVHVSLHRPGSRAERDRVIRQVTALHAAGVRSGVNLLVGRSTLTSATASARALEAAGVGPDRVLYLPMRGADTPTPRELATVAGSARFQSMTCLMGCAASPRFASIRHDKSVAWCSYTDERATLPTLDFPTMARALQQLRLRFCGGAAPAPKTISRRARAPEALPSRDTPAR